LPVLTYGISLQVCISAVNVVQCLIGDRLITCMYLHMSFEVCLLPCILQWCVHAELSLVSAVSRSRLLFPLPFSLSLPLSNASSSVHPRRLLWQHLVVSSKVPLAGALSLHVCLVLVLVRKPNHAEPKPRFFP